MPRQSIAARVERLEQRVTILEELPGRLDAISTQISQLSDEMHREFSNVRDEIRAGDKETGRSLREEIRASNDETVRTLRGEIRASSEEIMTRVRVLHEDMISRLALLQEGQQRRP